MLKSVSYQIFCIFLEKIFFTRKEQINAYIVAKDHRHYAHFVNNILSTNSEMCLRDMTKCLV